MAFLFIDKSMFCDNNFMNESGSAAAWKRIGKRKKNMSGFAQLPYLGRAESLMNKDELELSRWTFRFPVLTAFWLWSGLGSLQIKLWQRSPAFSTGQA